jgi:hypothetical protein
MLGMLLLVLALIAVVAWNIAVIAAFRIAKLAPAGQRLDAWLSLGWWRFAKVRELAGDAAIPHVKRYTQAFLAFFAAAVAALIIAGLLAIAEQNGTSSPGQAAAGVPLPIHTPYSSSLES